LKIDKGFLLLLVPLVAFLSLFAVPLLDTLVVSFYHYEGILDYRPPLTLENYVHLYQSRTIGLTFLRTGRIAALSSMLAVAIAYPLSYYLSWSTNRKGRIFVLSVTVFSLFASTLARALSWIYILGPEGVAGKIFAFMGLAGMHLLHTEFSVIVGLAHVIVPFATLAMISPLQRIRPSVRGAAMISGATKFQTFIYITLPLSIPGITAALAVCLALSLGAFVIPLMLGGGVVDMVSNLIFGRIRETLNFPLGSAMSFALLLFSILVLYAATVLTRRLGGH